VVGLATQLRANPGLRTADASASSTPPLRLNHRRPGEMSLTTSPAGLDDLALLRLPPDLRLTPAQFALVCAENRDAVLELAPDGRVIAMTPTGSETGSRNGELFFQLKLYAKRAGGWKAFDSSTGFQLPDGSVVSPDASLIRLDRWQALSTDERRGFAPLCPDLVVELASYSDEGPRGVSALRAKMAAYQANGARLGWLLLPQEQAVEIWPASAPHQRLERLQVLEATPEFPGLSLQVAEIWEG
jgi:Uma2 family endonuclease